MCRELEAKDCRKNNKERLFLISHNFPQMKWKHPFAESTIWKQQPTESTSSVLEFPLKANGINLETYHSPDMRFGNACLAAMVTAEALLKQRAVGRAVGN